MIHIHYTNMFEKAGNPKSERTAAKSRFAKAQKEFESRRAAGELGFLDLPDDKALHAQTTQFASRARGKFDDVVVLGIGGSALGPIALRTALRKPQWNLLSDRERDGWPRLHVLDNLDPLTIGGLLDRVVKLERTLFIVTSKSGGTAETMAQYLVVRDRLQRAQLALDAHIVFVTDPQKGALRPIANREGIPALDIPANVGGRFSVLTPVGVLPAAMIGIDTAGMLAGAGEMVASCTSPKLAGNPAGTFAMLQFLADTRAGKHVHVMMPYSDALRDMAAWFVQLWAESLGKVKRGGKGKHVGPTPLAALGATDQHSQVQLFMEGSPDKTITLISVPRAQTGHPGRGEGSAPDITIPKLHADVPDLAYLGGHSLGEVLDVERRATAGALARRGRPNMTVELEDVSPKSIGALFMLLEMATIYAGSLYDVNPLDQPGVELGKNFTYAIMGRPGSDAARKEWDSLPKPNPKFRV
jgi:glucose-6-phosphate isomerase